MTTWQTLTAVLWVYMFSCSLILTAAGPAETLEVFQPETATTSSLSMPPLPLTKEKAKLLIDQEIVPQLVPNPPSSIAKLVFGNTVARDIGLTLTPTQVHEHPRITYNVRANKHHTIVLFDPDAPSRANPMFGQWVHYLIVNVPGRDLTRGDTLVEYVGAAPPEGSGKHRYITLVYEQSKKINVEAHTRISRTSGAGRSKWNMERWIANNDPQAKLISINFFQAEYDDFVPQIYNQLVD